MASDDSAEIMHAAKRTSDLLAGRIPTTARVKAPREELLVIELVPLSLVARLQEVSSDASVSQGMFWAILGALFGVTTSSVLEGTPVQEIDKATWVTIVALIIGVGVCWTLWQRVAKRADEAKKRLFSDMQEP